MFVWILCAWSQTRRNKAKFFPQYPYKQLIEIDGQPLLQKTINNLKSRWYEPVIITKNDELKIDNSFDPDDNRFTVSSLLSSKDLRQDRNVILLWDVNYSEQSLDKIFNTKESVKVLGSKWEIFAISFTDKELVAKHLKRMIRYAEKNDNKYIGKLRTFYRSLEWFPIEEHRFGKYYDNIKDVETRDFDSQQEYKEYLENTVKRTYTLNIMTHSSRKEFADELKRLLPMAYVSICDEWLHPARYKARTLERKATDYHIVIQDDWFLCDDFVNRMEKVLSLWHPVINFHTRDRKQLKKYKGKWNFFDKLYGGVAVAIKTDIIDDMLERVMDYHKKTNYSEFDDKVMRIYFDMKGIKCYYTNPCYVDHREWPSIEWVKILQVDPDKVAKQRRGSLEFLW